MNSMLKHVKVMLVFLLAIPILIACGGGGGDDAPPPKVGENPPEFILSADQQKLISDYGNPAYLTINVDSEEGAREEVWTYLGEVKKMYVFWDGERAKEESITLDPALYSNPTYINPALFTKETKKSDIIELFGNNYTLSEDKSFEGSEAWNYENQGLIVAFQNESLLMVQTLDKP